MSSVFIQGCSNCSASVAYREPRRVMHLCRLSTSSPGRKGSWHFHLFDLSLLPARALLAKHTSTLNPPKMCPLCSTARCVVRSVNVVRYSGCMMYCRYWHNLHCQLQSTSIPFRSNLFEFLTWKKTHFLLPKHFQLERRLVSKTEHHIVTFLK